MKLQRMTMIGLMGAMAMLLTACAEQYAEESNILTGLRGPGFNYSDDGYGNWWHNGTFENVYVGRQFEAIPTADCRDSSGNKADWNGDLSIATGELPPGLEITSQTPITISGVPTRAGTWYLTVVFRNLTCAGIYYEDAYRDLTFKTIGN